MDTPVLLQSLDDGVLLLSYNRPERNNAWTTQMEEAYFGALAGASEDPDVRVIVVTGAGRSFCPGMDMQVLKDATEGNRPPDEPRLPMTFARSVPKPVIAAINGACAGIGFIQACSADIRFAGRGAKLTTSFARRGLPAENSIAWLLPRLIGTGKAMDLLLSGRVVTAEEAHQMGLVDRLCEPEELMESALAYASDLARNCSPRSMAVIKQQVLGDWERTAEDSRKLSLKLLGQLRHGADFGEGVRSFTEKRAPEFEGLSIKVDVERD